MLTPASQPAEPRGGRALRCLGAQALGLEVDWRYCFVSPGERAATTPGVVYIDVGGTVAPGVIDHHGIEGPGTCSAMLVVEQREHVYNHLLSPWLARFEEGRIPPGTVWTPTLILHHDPDFDALAAVFLVRILTVDGDLPRYARALAGYALEVDQGRYPLHLRAAEEGDFDFDPRELDAIHLAYLAIQSLTDPDGRELSSGEKLRLGIELLECVIEGITAARGDTARTLEEMSPGAPGVASWRADARFAPFAALLDLDLELFREDFRQGMTLGSVPLPAADGGEAIPVRAFVAAGPPRSALAKYWVRSAGLPFFICPLGPVARQGDAGRAARRRFVLSLDPMFSVAGRKPSLRGLGFRLERAESTARRASGTEVRRGMPRYGGGYCDNPDPWYDGRGHEWTIVDSPLVGTVLPYDEVIALATGGEFWKVPLAGASLYLVWTEAEPEASIAETLGPPIAGLRHFAGMSETLAAFYRESSEEGALAGSLSSTPAAQGFSVREWVRRFPEGTCWPLHIVEIVGGPGSSLEELVRRRREVLEERIPDFSLARVRTGIHFSAPELIDRLLEELGGNALRPLRGLSPAGERLLFNGRSLVTAAPEGGPMVEGEPHPDFEVLLYAAFLYQTLLRFSERLSALVPPGQSRLIPGSTQRLREDFLRFEARYYQLEVSRAPRARALFGEMAAALGLSGLFAKVRSELDRLGEIEERVAAARQQRADGLIQGALFILAISGLLQTIVTFWMWQDKGWWMLSWVIPVVGAFLALLFWARVRGRRGDLEKL